MKEDYILKIDGSERRFLATEVRADKESRKVSGYAAVFNKDSHDLGGFIERIDQRAFDDVLKDDAVALLNHDQNLVLARNNKTLTLSVDKVGLRYEFEAPDTTAGNDLIENLRLGNIDKSSFAFTVDKEGQEWDMRNDGPDVRTITKIKRLYDVSPVTYPAYPDTSVAQRARESVKEPSFIGYHTNSTTGTTGFINTTGSNATITISDGNTNSFRIEGTDLTIKAPQPNPRTFPTNIKRKQLKLRINNY